MTSTGLSNYSRWQRPSAGSGRSTAASPTHQHQHSRIKGISCPSWDSIVPRVHGRISTSGVAMTGSLSTWAPGRGEAGTPIKTGLPITAWTEDGLIALAVPGCVPSVASVMDGLLTKALGLDVMTALTTGVVAAEPINNGDTPNALLNSLRVMTPSWFWSSASNRLLLPPVCRFEGLSWPWTCDCCWDATANICCCCCCCCCEGSWRGDVGTMTMTPACAKGTGDRCLICAPGE